jgi:hypothetical protein
MPNIKVEARRKECVANRSNINQSFATAVLAIALQFS